MLRVCGGTAEDAVMDVAAGGVRAGARATVTASSTGDTASTVVAKRRRTGDGENESLKLSSNNSTCTQLRSSAGRRNSASPHQVPVAVTDSFHCLSTTSQASVSSCSSYGSSEVERDKLRFTDLEEDCGEADSWTSRFSGGERREDTASSVVGGGEETDSMNSSAAEAADPNPLERPEEFQSSVDTVIEGLSGKIGKQEIKRPSDFEIEEFFAAAEADNLLDVEHFKSKYNFDFVKEEPLKGRFEWHRISPKEQASK